MTFLNTPQTTSQSHACQMICRPKAFKNRSTQAIPHHWSHRAAQQPQKAFPSPGLPAHARTPHRWIVGKKRPVIGPAPPQVAQRGTGIVRISPRRRGLRRMPAERERTSGSTMAGANSHPIGTAAQRHPQIEDLACGWTHDPRDARPHHLRLAWDFDLEAVSSVQKEYRILTRIRTESFEK